MEGREEGGGRKNKNDKMMMMAMTTTMIKIKFIFIIYDYFYHFDIHFADHAAVRRDGGRAHRRDRELGQDRHDARLHPLRIRLQHDRQGATRTQK